MNGEDENGTTPASWNRDVRGEEALRLINTDGVILRTEAGPGTGKTFGLVRRVERILHPDGLAAKGAQVLVVAFNRVIAGELRNDVEARLGAVGIEARPTIRTVHALCLQVVGEDMRLLLAHEREAMLYDLLTVYPALREAYGPRAYAAIGQALRSHEAEHEDHPDVWMAARQWLDRHGAALISDLPPKLLHHLRAGDFGDQRYMYVLVDEFQDLSAAEQELFYRLRADDGQFYAVGDSRQSIYRFRGNDPGGLRTLDGWAEDEGLTVTDLPMRGCQRCPAEIVEAANRLMSLSGQEAMIPIREEAADLHVVHWATPADEARGMAEKLVAKLRASPDEERHLVMTTRRQFGADLRDAIVALDEDVRVDLGFEEGLLDCWPVREAFLFFGLLVAPDPPSWRGWFAYRNLAHGQLYIAPERNSIAYLRLLDSCGDEVTDAVLEALCREDRGAARGTGGTVLWDRARRFLELRDSTDDWRASDAGEVIEEVLAAERWMIVGGENAELVSVDLEVLAQKARQILAEVRADGVETPVDQLRAVAEELRYKIATREPLVSGGPTQVQITTLWGAKGVTADHVYVLGLCDEAIPGARRDEYPGTDEDYLAEQRRLFYVSITRAKESLVLSRASRVRRGDGRQLGLNVVGTRHWCDLRATRFLREIMPYLPDGREGAEWDDWP